MKDYAPWLMMLGAIAVTCLIAVSFNGEQARANRLADQRRDLCRDTMAGLDMLVQSAREPTSAPSRLRRLVEAMPYHYLDQSLSLFCLGNATPIVDGETHCQLIMSDDTRACIEDAMRLRLLYHEKWGTSRWLQQRRERRWWPRARGRYRSH